MYSVILIIVCIAAICFVLAWYKGIDHYGWREGSKPSAMAKISSENIQKRAYNKAKDCVHCAVTFEFADGFFYSSVNLELPNYDEFNPRDASLNELRLKAQKAHLIEAHKKTGIPYEEPAELRYVIVDTDRRKSVILLSLKAASIILVIAGAVLALNFFNLRNGDSYMNSGDYEDAIAAYSSAGIWDMNGKKLKEAEEKYHESTVNLIAKNFSSGNYENALKIMDDKKELLTKEDRPKISEAIMAFIERTEESEYYEVALTILKNNSVRIFMKEENEQKWEAGERKLQEILKKYAVSETEKGNYNEALKITRYNSEYINDEEFMHGILEKFTDGTIEALSRLESPDYDTARKQGERITDTNLVLKYCHSLHALSYDMKVLYPDGVHVDANLDEYHFTKIAANTSDDSGASGKKMNFFPMLIFRREESSPIKPFWESQNPSYSVRLLPGEMFAYASGLAAKTLNDAASILIADGVYVSIGTVKETTRRITTRNGIRTNEFEYSSDLKIYSAVNNLTMYDAKNPSKRNCAYHGFS